MKKVVILISILSVSSLAIDFDLMKKKSSSSNSVEMSVHDADKANEHVFQQLNQKQRETINDVMSSIGSNRNNFVMVTFDTTCGLLATCTEHKLSVRGSPGTFSESAGGSGAIHKNGNGKVAGTYSYVGLFKRNGSWRSCSGSFYLSGKKLNYAIRVYEDCRDAGSGEY